MGGREIYNELARLAQNPKITFEKGILRTLNNSALGFVSDLHNMEINENGIVQRRRGTRLISKATEQHRWVFLEEAIINGVNFLFGMDYRRRLYCWLKYWPEINIKVFSKSITNDFTINTGAGETATRQVCFSRGSKFWFNNFENNIDIVNNFGDIFRIMKNGIIRITKNVYSPSDEKIKDDMDAVRTGESLDIVCYMDVKDISQREIPDGSVNFIDTDNSDYEEIIGDIEVARVNDAGNLSLLSEPYGLANYRKGFVSMVDGFSLSEDGVTLEVDFKQVAWYGKSPNEAGFLIERNSDGTYNVKKSSFPIQSPEYKQIEILVFEDRVIGDYFFDGDRIFSTSNVDNKMYMFLPYGTGLPIGDSLSSSSIGRFIKIKNIRGYDSDAKDISIGDLDAYIVAKHEDKFQMPTISDATSVAESSGILTISYDVADFEDDYQKGTYYELNVDADYLDRFDLIERIEYKASDGRETDSSFRGHLTGDLVYDTVASDSAAGNYTAFEYRYWYEGALLDEDLISMRNLGFNTWSIDDFDAAPLGVVDNIIDDVNTLTKEVRITPPTNAPDVYLKKDEAADFLTNGFRFAVVQEDRILATSQRGLSVTSSDNKDFIYKIEDNRNSGVENEGNQPAGQFYKIYSPVCAIQHIGIGTSAYKRKDIADIVRDPKHIKVNNNSVFVVQGNQLWTGASNDWLLTDVLEISMGIIDIEVFHSGILLATEKGLYYFEQGKALRKVINGDNVLSIEIQKNRGGAVVFAEDNNIYMCQMTISSSGSEYPQAIKISSLISEEMFNPKSSIVSVDETIYISSGYEVWGFSIVGKSGRWDKKYVFEMPIDKLAKWDNRLVVAFDQQPDKTLMFTPPSGISVIGDL